MLKKGLAILLSAVILFLLCACNGSDGNNESKESSVAAESTDQTSGDSAEPSDDEKVTLVCWAWDKNCDLAIETGRLYAELTGKNVTVKCEQITQEDIKQKMIAINESGDYKSLPDFSLAEDVAFAKHVSDTPNLIYEVTSFVKDWDQLGVAKTSLTTVDGKSYGIPVDNSTAIAMYRTDKLKEAGYSIDNMQNITWDEFIPIAADFKEKTGMYLLSMDLGVMIENMLKTTTEIFNEDGSPNLANEEVYKIFEECKKVYDSGTVYFPNDWNDYISSFTGGTVAAGTAQGAWIANNVNTAEDQAGLWDLATIPKVNENSLPANSGGSSWFVMATSERADIAAEMLAYMYADDGMMELADYVTEKIGYIMTYKPLIESGFYNEIDDGYYRKGFWGDLATVGNASPVAISSAVYKPTTSELLTAAQAICIENADIQSTVNTAQETIEFQMK